jgi:hypothetical protein
MPHQRALCKNDFVLTFLEKMFSLRNLNKNWAIPLGMHRSKCKLRLQMQMVLSRVCSEKRTNYR